MPERSVGAFGGWTGGNEWASTNGIMHCCTGNATPAIYYVWEHILEYKGRSLTVNLLMNRAEGDEVSVTLPIAARQVWETVGAASYSFTLKGYRCGGGTFRPERPAVSTFPLYAELRAVAEGGAVHRRESHSMVIDATLLSGGFHR
jgi:hypothetical protein